MTQMDEEGGPVRTCGPYAATRFQAFQPKDQLGACVICLDPIEEGANVTSLLPCEDKQQFHADCINSWLERNATCPTCRKGANTFLFLRRMSDSPTDPHVQYEGLAAICRTASVEGPASAPACHVNRLGELGACRLVAGAMRSFPSDARIQLLGLEAVEALAAHSEGNLKLFEQAGLADLLSRVFTAFPMERDMQTAACQAVVALATGHLGWQGLLGAAGICVLIMDMLRRWPEDYAAQLAGLYAMNALLGKHEPNHRLLFEAGAAPALLHMMRRFWRDMDVLDGAVTALCNLSAQGDAARDAIGTLEGCKVLLAVMAAHPEARDLQIKCCFTLSKLVFQHAENCTRVAASRGLLILVGVMDKYKDELAVQIAIAAAIVALFMPTKHDAVPMQQDSHMDSKAPALEVQGPKIPNPSSVHSDGLHEALAFNALVRSLAAFPAETELEASCSPALLLLLEAVDGRQPLLEDPATAQSFMCALRNYAYDEDSQELLLEVVILVTDERQQPRDVLLQAGLATHVLELMGRTAEGSASLQEKCCMVLAALTEESATNVELLWSAESVARLCSVMEAHPTHAALQHFALSCLQTLVEEGKPDKRALVTPAVLRLACIALSNHWQDDDIRNASLGLLLSLAAESGNDGKPYIDAVLRILGEVWVRSGTEAVTRAGVMRWLAVVAHDCSQEELHILVSGGGRTLMDEWFVRFAASDNGFTRLAGLELLAALPQRGQPVWPEACNFAVDGLRHVFASLQAADTPGNGDKHHVEAGLPEAAGVALAAVLALAEGNPNNRKCLKDSDMTEILVSASKIQGHASIGQAANRVLQALTLGGGGTNGNNGGSHGGNGFSSAS